MPDTSQFTLQTASGWIRLATLSFPVVTKLTIAPDLVAIGPSPAAAMDGGSASAPVRASKATLLPIWFLLATATQRNGHNRSMDLR